MSTQAVFYRNGDGREPVWEFLRSELPPNEAEAIGRQIRALNGLRDDVPPPPFPQTSQIEGALRELRCHFGNRLYRILYRRSGNLLVLLHILSKDTKAIPRRDIELAQRRWRDFKRRMDDRHRRGPRAAGRDAP